VDITIINPLDGMDINYWVGLLLDADRRFLAAAGHHTVKLFDVRSTNPPPAW